jgi:HB1, ASXL, restriction endonuclease HTH domain/Restriction endonuclease
MTFTEAAMEVLRTAGEPLHYKRITELAIERNLLSHVGKTPEVTMSSRLAMLVKKDRGQSPLMKVKPGVFAIRESALQDFAAAVAAAKSMEAESTGEEPSTEAPVAEPKEAAPALPGADVFPEEEGDDDPILAGLEQESGEGGDKGGRRRRRRRRRGKGGDREPGMEGGARPEAPAPREHGQNHSREAREPRRDEPRDRDRDRDRDRSMSREPRREDAPALDFNRQPEDGDLLGKDLADAVHAVLGSGERAAQSFTRVADMLVRRGRLSGAATALAPTIAAAARADVARAQLANARPRFRVQGQSVSLSEWHQPKQLARAEQDLLGAANRYGVELRRALINRLSDLPVAGFAELVATWLNTEGVTALRAVRRPGSSASEFHFAGTRKLGNEETRLAIVVLRGGRELQRETVIEVRGALHHYGQATSAWLVTTGRVTSGAREEAAMTGAAPCALFDGMELAGAMERLGIAVRTHVIAHHEIDFELLESLGDTLELRERRARDERAARDARRSEPRQERPRAAGEGTEADEGEGDDDNDGEAADADARAAVEPTDNSRWEGTETDDVEVDVEADLDERSDEIDGPSDDDTDSDADSDDDSDEDDERDD